MVRQPRIPCYKLAAKFQRNDILARFLRAAAAGSISRWNRKGRCARETLSSFSLGNPRHHDRGDEPALCREKYNQDLLRKAIATQALPEDWREYSGSICGPATSGSCVRRSVSDGAASRAFAQEVGTLTSIAVQFGQSMILDALHRIANHRQSLSRGGARR